MTSDRPYRDALRPWIAVSELREGAGGQFDPDVVDELVGALREHHAIDLRLFQQARREPAGRLASSARCRRRLRAGGGAGAQPRQPRPCSRAGAIRAASAEPPEALSLGELHRQGRARVAAPRTAPSVAGCAPWRAASCRSAPRRSRCPLRRCRSRRRRAVRRCAGGGPARPASRGARRAGSPRPLPPGPTTGTGRRRCSGRGAGGRSPSASRSRPRRSGGSCRRTTSSDPVRPCAISVSNGPAYGRGGYGCARSTRPCGEDSSRSGGRSGGTAFGRCDVAISLPRWRTRTPKLAQGRPPTFETTRWSPS